MPKKSPDAVFEVVFEGIYPERIPLGTLSRIFSSIQRLASGTDSAEDEEPDEDLSGSGEELSLDVIATANQIQLLDVKRGSAVYQFAGEAENQIMARLLLVGDVLADPDHIGQNDYLLGPLERISKSAKTLGCDVVVKKPGRDGAVLATIGPASYDGVARSIFVSGDTSITGNVKRVGGATITRCALRVPFQHKLLYCKVGNNDIARKLGDLLYKNVSAAGQARWIKGTWHINAFTVTGVKELKKGSVLDAFKALHDAGGSGWDEIDDPAQFLGEVTGK